MWNSVTCGMELFVLWDVPAHQLTASYQLAAVSF